MTAHASAQKTVEEWKAQAIRTYPDLAKAGTAFYKQFLADYSNLKKTDTKFFENPQWPMLMAQSVDQQLQGKIPGIDIPAEATRANQKAEVRLVTAEDVKKKWIEELPQLPRTLEWNYHTIKKQVEVRKKAIEEGEYDSRAHKEATRMNIAAYLAAGKTQEAGAMQQMLSDQEALEAQRLRDRKLDSIERDVRNLEIWLR